MGKKNKLSKLSDSDEEFLAKGSRKERSLAVSGKPDQSDIDNLRVLFRTYDHATGGRLTQHLKLLDAQRRLNNRPQTMQAIDKSEYLTFSLPRDLQEEMEKYWPSIWTKPEHLKWFLKNFPEYRT